MKNGLRRFIGKCLITFWWIIALVRIALDLIGWSTAPDDLPIALGRYGMIFEKLFELPVWLPVVGAMVATVAWFYWGREPISQASAQPLRKQPDVEQPPKPEAKFLGDMQLSDRTDFDLIAHRLVVRATRSDDGIDISALIQYRNRSTRHLTLSKPDADFQIEGQRTSNERKSGGISSSLSKEATDTIRFAPIRVYDERERKGSAFFSVSFGASAEAARSRMIVHYDFTLKSYPQDKSTDAVIGDDILEKVTYYVKKAMD